MDSTSLDRTDDENAGAKLLLLAYKSLLELASSATSWSAASAFTKPLLLRSLLHGIQAACNTCEYSCI